MINKIRTFTIEEKLLVQAIISDYNKYVMSIGFVTTAWDLRAYAPNNSQVVSVKNYVSYVMDLQVELTAQLAMAGIPEEMCLNAPISKTVFQSMSMEKKNIVQELLVLLGEKLGEFKMFGNQAYVNIWNNKLIRWVIIGLKFHAN